MTGSQIERKRRITESEFLAVGCNHVTAGLCAVTAIEQIPVCSRKDNPRAVPILEELCTTRMVRMAMAHDGVLDIGRIETEVLQSPRDLVFNGVIVDRIDNDDA